MEVDIKERIYYKQYDVNYLFEGKFEFDDGKDKEKKENNIENNIDSNKEKEKVKEKENNNNNYNYNNNINNINDDNINNNIDNNINNKIEKNNKNNNKEIKDEEEIEINIEKDKENEQQDKENNIEEEKGEENKEQDKENKDNKETIKSHPLKLNLYFDPMRRSSEILDVDILIKEQELSLKEIKDNNLPLDDDITLKRLYCFFNIEYDKQTRRIIDYTLNKELVLRRKKEAGFFANTTNGLDNMDPSVVNYHYRLRDEQEKYFKMMKSSIECNRLRVSTDLSKEGRSFILFIAQILGCYLSYIRKDKLEKEFKLNSMGEVLNEMRSIRYIEHKNTSPYITPFVGKQLNICEAFGFEVPEGCIPDSLIRSDNRKKERKNENKKKMKKK